MEDPAAALQARARSRLGQVLREKWRVDKLLGIGGMAVVYEATHVNNGRRVAIKLLHPELSNNVEVRTRFLREGYVANKVEHPGTVAILDNDTSDDGSVFLVMELLEGETLEDRRERSGALPVHEVLSLGDRLLDVLAVAHEKGVVHRDIKPENIFLTREGNVKVLDFGIARIRELQASRLTLTSAGAIGTPAFMPPEQARGRWDEVGPHSDIWAVGATMFTLLAGQLVHQAETVNELMLAAMTKHAPPIQSVVPGVPPAVAQLIDRALAYDPKVRWPNARVMQNALRAAYQSLDRMSMVGPPSARLSDPGVSGAFHALPGAPLGAPVHLVTAGPMNAPGGTHSLVTGQPVTMVGAKPARKGGSPVLAIVGALAGMLVVAFVLLALLLRKPTAVPAVEVSASAVVTPPPGSAAASSAPSAAASSAPSASSAPDAPSAAASGAPDAPSAVPSADPAPSASAAASSKPLVNRPGKFLRNPKRHH